MRKNRIRFVHKKYCEKINEKNFIAPYLKTENSVKKNNVFYFITYKNRPT